MRLTKKFTYGFLILALGMMLTDCYRLLEATQHVVSSSVAQGVRKF
jgi:hypothetical protein